MAIVTTILRRTIEGGRRVVYGKSVISGGVATGEVTTSLGRVIFFEGTVKSAAASAVTANETFPVQNKATAITIITSNNNETVYWRAVGDPT